MEKYHPKTIVAEIADRLFRFSAAWFAGIIWFVLLWGVTLPALFSGTAFGILIWLCVRQFSKRITAKRESQMRRTIGGELAVERLLLESPRRAAFLCALWINPKYNIEIHKAIGWSVTGVLNDQKAVITLISQHPSLPVNIQQIISCMRHSHRQQAEQTILCLTAPLSKEARIYASALDPPPVLIERNELIEWAGLASPATDEDLRKLGRQKNTRRSAKDWLAVILDASRAKKYFFYGSGMALYGMLADKHIFTILAVFCMGLSVCSKVHAYRLNGGTHWKA